VPKIGVANPTSSLEALVDADLDTLVTALYVKIDDMLVKDRRPGHPARLSQPELVCLAVAQALLGFHSEHRWIRFALCHLRGEWNGRGAECGGAGEFGERAAGELVGHLDCLAAGQCVFGRRSDVQT
jgi:hypothetical protein